MKTALALILLGLSWISIPASPSAVILERGPHHRVWQNAAGGSYVGLATGLCYQRDAEGPWLDSRELIEILPTGEGIARQGQHQVILPANINQGVIEYLSPDRRRFQSRTLGLAYFDAATGKSVLIAELQESVGKLVQPNQMLYPNAFTDLEADLRFTYRLESFEADVVLRQREIRANALWGQIYSLFISTHLAGRAAQRLPLAGHVPPPRCTTRTGSSRFGRRTRTGRAHRLDGAQMNNE